MTLGLNLVLALALLAPGFAVYAGIYSGTQLTVIKSPPPPPGSILSLGLITMGALGAHLIGVGLFAGQEALCHAWLACAPVRGDPNPYLAMIGAVSHPSGVDGKALLSILGFLVLLAGAAFGLSTLAVGRALRAEWFQRLVFGWMREIGTASSESEIVLCYVLSDVEESGSIVGYEGILENLSLNHEREILDVTLRDVEMFYLRLTAKGISRRRRIDRETPIKFLNLRSSQIQNIAFEKVLFS